MRTLAVVFVIAAVAGGCKKSPSGQETCSEIQREWTTAIQGISSSCADVSECTQRGGTTGPTGTCGLNGCDGSRVFNLDAYLAAPGAAALEEKWNENYCYTGKPFERQECPCPPECYVYKELLCVHGGCRLECPADGGASDAAPADALAD